MKTKFRIVYCYKVEDYQEEFFDTLSGLIDFINEELKEHENCLYYQSSIVTYLDELTEGDSFGELPPVSSDKILFKKVIS